VEVQVEVEVEAEAAQPEASRKMLRCSDAQSQCGRSADADTAGKG
jgi:hypothetical protein